MASVCSFKLNVFDFEATATDRAGNSIRISLLPGVSPRDSFVRESDRPSEKNEATNDV